jgi:predicted transcriptional regulator
MMADAALLMSIRPRYAESIFTRTKTVELRRRRPKSLEPGDLVYLYVSAPVKAIAGAFSVASVLECPVPALWRTVRSAAAVTRSEFLAYYSGVTVGVAIFVAEVWLLPKPMYLDDLRKKARGFCPPQSYRYASIPGIADPRTLASSRAPSFGQALELDTSHPKRVPPPTPYASGTQ